LSAGSSELVVERPIVLIITSYNNSQWYQKNLDSVFEQNYDNWRIVYIDDVSPDGTGELVEKYLKNSEFSDKVTFVKNKRRKLKMENFYYAVHNYCSDEEIVIDLDGDDWLAHPGVLSIINKEYANPSVWLTYGTYKVWPNPVCEVHCKTIPQKIINTGDYRNYSWVTSQLRTFYAWLFKRILPEDLMFRGKFVSMASDLAYMFPMLEMAGGRFKFIREVLYIYNRANPINDNKVNKRLQSSLTRAIRGKKRYKKLQIFSEV